MYLRYLGNTKIVINIKNSVVVQLGLVVMNLIFEYIFYQ